MKKYILTIITIFLSATTMLYAQERINNKDVLEMKKFGLSDSLIKAKIRAFDPDFDTSNEGILSLKKAGLSDDVVSLIIERQAKLQELIDDTFYLTSLDFVDNKIINCISVIKNKFLYLL